MTCYVCDGQLVELGTLGRLEWFRCRDCGTVQFTEMVLEEAKTAIQRDKGDHEE